MTSVCDESHKLQDVPDLIPARMLNEFAYCPRLAYLEWVQGEFADNLDVLEGRFGHRRVEGPSRGPVPEPPQAAGQESSDQSGETDARAEAGPHPSPLPKGEGENVPHPGALQEGEGENGHHPGHPASEEGAEGETPPKGEGEVETIHTRSLMLSAPGEGLIARLDLLDFSAAEAIPIDYKRGRVPDVPGGAWEPEQVQLCAQGLILRENGYHCEGGILYFIESRRRVSIPFDERLVERTRELVGQMRAMAASNVIPPPLDDSPKCPRCSLVGICLPDETRLLTTPEPSGKREARRLVPARDDALPLCVQEQGVTLGKSGDVLTLSRRGETIRKVKLIDVSQVSLFGNVQVTAQALREITTAGIPICHFSYGGWFHALTSGLVHKNVELRMAQSAAALDHGRSLEFARQFVVGKIRNGRTLLRRHLDVGADGVLAELAALGQKAESARDATTLLGIEGMAAKTYFAGFARLLKGDQAFNLEGRNRRPPRDPVNALLSFLYAILVKDLTIVLHAAGFDPMLGFYHRPRYGRPSLALDLAEPFRPLVADSVVLTLINNGEVAASSFIRRAGGVALTEPGRRAVLAAYERRMETLVTHPIFGYRVSYRRVLEVQARLLGRVLLGEISEYPVFCTR